MLAVFKKELKAYFLTPIGYLYMGLFLLITGIFFLFDNLLSARSQYADFLGSLLLIFLFGVPILTMRLFSEEKRHKTDQLLLTSPVSITGIVCGKFLAAMTVFCGTLLVTVAYPVIIAIFGDLQTWETLGSYIGFIFLGACYISVGIFISSITENQLTSAFLSFITLLLIWFLDPISSIAPSDTKSGIVSSAVLLALLLLFIFFSTRNWIIVLSAAILGFLVIGGFYLFRQSVFAGLVRNLMAWFSLNSRYNPFTMGLLKIDSLLYYASFSGIFLFLTVRLIEKRRWN